MAKILVIVESPAKVKTINKILGDKYKVMSSMGHLIDLPASKLGVDLEDNFKPKFIVVRKKQKILTQLKKEAKTKDTIYIATDPDREGEAIGWNIINHIGDGKKYFRVTFHEITKEALTRAFKTPTEFDKKKIDAQVARRILDRIVGYQLSPLLWKKVGSRLSAGRVQSVALRLIVEREREIQKFIPQEYWQIAVELQKKDRKGVLTAALEKINGDKFEIETKTGADDLTGQIKKENFEISSVTEREVKRNPLPPFITSTLQQEAFNKLGFPAAKTMMIAQQLYEGIELGDGETAGLITYMRTDSVNIAKEAIGHVRELIKEKFGPKFLPAEPNVYKSKKSAQEAHEAIRPTDVKHTPESVQEYLEADQLKLYELIWKRFVSCQMMPAIFQNRKVEITAGKFQFGVGGSQLLFDGYLSVYKDDREESSVDLSDYQKGDALKLVDTKPSQHFTKPPPRYSEGSLVKALEEDGIGRPSTYAPIIHTLVARNYVFREKGYFKASDLGMQICDLLVEYFPKIMDIGFTATMEEHLDLVEEGELESTQLLNEFYTPFKEEYDYAMANIEKVQAPLLDKLCPQCQKPLMVKWGRNGRFISCSGFPECKYAAPFTTGVKCPQPDCGGELVERRSRRGQFFGCSNYPKCTHISNKLPEKTASEQAS